MKRLRPVLAGMLGLAAAMLTAPSPRAEFYLPFFGKIGAPDKPAPRSYQPAARPEPKPVSHPHPRPTRPVYVPTPSSVPTPSTATAPNTATAPTVVPDPPVAPQFTLAVLGDSMGELLSQGLKEAFADRPEIAINKRARGSSGLVRDDFLDWPKVAREMVESGDKLDAAVIMLGSNDRQPLRDADGPVEPFTERWKQLYAQRVDDLLEPFRAKRIPVIWVGLPIVKNERISADFVLLNAIYRERVQKAGMTYVDIWASFLNDADGYDPMGPDIAGQTVRLRSADGVYFTRSGARKLAFFTERELGSLIDRRSPPQPEQDAAVDPNDQLRRDPSAPGPLVDPRLNIPLPDEALSPVFVAKPLAGPVLPLTVPPLSPGAALASVRPAGAVFDPSSDVGAVLRLGRAPRPKTGRADDFSWSQ